MRSGPKLLIITALVSAVAAAQTPVIVPVTADVFTFRGSGADVVNAIAVDGAGNIYIAGRTTSRDLPGTERAFQRQPRGEDAFVAKLDAQGRTVWTTYLGGNDARIGARFGGVHDDARAVGVDPAGNVHVAGSTGSTDFPTANAFQSSAQANTLGAGDGFLAKISPDGSQLLFSTYLGGTDSTSWAEAVAVGPAGEVWVAVRTGARQFPTTHDLSTNGNGSVVVGKFSTVGSPLWLTRLPIAAGVVPSMVVDDLGQPRIAAGGGFTTLDVTGSRAVTTASSRISSLATRSDLAIAPDGSTIVAGQTIGQLPVLNAWQSQPGGSTDAFVAVFNPNGEPSTVSYYGGAGAEGSPVVAADREGRIHVAMSTASASLSTIRAPVPRHPDGPAYTTADRGNTWWWVGADLGGITGFAVDTVRNVLYVAAGGILQSTDNGASWQLWKTVPDGALAPKIALDPRDPGVMYTGEFGLYRIDGDGPGNPQLLRPATGFGGFHVVSLAVSPHDGSVWVGTGDGVEMSVDRGRTWTHRDRGLPMTIGGRTIESPRVLTFDARRPGVVYGVLNDDRGLARSSDNGLSWTIITETFLNSSGYPAGPDVTDLALDPGDARRLYVATRFHGLIVTDDDGRSWRTAIENASVTAVAADFAPPYQLYAAIRDFSATVSPLRISRDRGVTWSAPAIGPVFRDAATQLFVDPRDPVRLYSASQTVAAAPFVARVDPPASGGRYAPSFASYLLHGDAVDIAATPSGQTIVALNDGAGAHVMLVRFGR